MILCDLRHAKLGLSTCPYETYVSPSPAKSCSTRILFPISLLAPNVRSRRTCFPFLFTASLVPIDPQRVVEDSTFLWPPGPRASISHKDVRARYVHASRVMNRRPTPCRQSCMGYYYTAATGRRRRRRRRHALRSLSVLRPMAAAGLFVSSSGESGQWESSRAGPLLPGVPIDRTT